MEIHSEFVASFIESLKGKSAPVITSGLKNLGEGNMAEGLEKIAITVAEANAKLGRRQGVAIGAGGTLVLCGCRQWIAKKLAEAKALKLEQQNVLAAFDDAEPDHGCEADPSLQKTDNDGMKGE